MTRNWLAVATGMSLALVGCGGEGGSAETVAIYISDGLRGGGRANDVVRAEQLALQEAGGRAGDFKVRLVVLGEGSPKGIPPEVTGNARKAVADPQAVALLGNSRSEWTAASLPITNRAGLLQVSPVSTYTGLTRSEGAEQGEPGRYRASGTPNFARVIPDDGVQAAAIVAYLKRDGIRRVGLLGEPTTFGQGLVRLLREKIPAAGIGLLDADALAGVATDPAGTARLLKRRGAGGFVYAGSAPSAVVRSFAAAGPGLRVYFPDAGFSLGEESEDLGDAESAVRLTGPPGETPEARRFAAAFEEQYGTQPDAQALGGYESMRAVLDAIRRAGPDGSNRKAVRDALFSRRVEDSVFGPYAIDENGDASIRRYGLYRFRDRRLESVATVTVE